MATASVVGTLREPIGARRKALAYTLAVVGPALLVSVFAPLRSDLRSQTVGFCFTVLVVAVAALGRFGPGVLVSVISFLCFNFFFLQPYGSFEIARAEDVTALLLFLGLSVLVSYLFAKATERAEAAESREAELRTLLDLSRTLVVRGPGDDTYRSLLEQVAEAFGFEAAGLFVQIEGEGLQERLVVGAGSGVLSPRWDPSDPGRAPERLPLSVGNRNLGLIVLRGERPELSPAESRVLRAVSDQLALVLERDRLLRSATAAEVLRQTEALRKRMLAAVSHDLRSPLAAIKASVTDLLDPEVQRSEADRGEVLRTIDAETDRLDALVANLLDMSRIEAGVLRARPEVVDLPLALTAAVDAAAHRWPLVEIHTRFDDPLPAVTADPVFLDRVIANLLDNAARSAVRSMVPVVEVVVGRWDDAMVAVEVVDHGEGIDAGTKERLFTPFAELRERGGTVGPGLGLAIAKGFVDLMDGELWAGDTEGGGATFAFSLPNAAS